MSFSSSSFELPVVAPRASGVPYRYAYAIRARPATFIDGLVKFDTFTRTVKAWEEPHTSPSEPIFVPRPRGRNSSSSSTSRLRRGASAHEVGESSEQRQGENRAEKEEEGREEDDGVVLSVVLDGRTSTSFLLILDGPSFEEVCRIPLGVRVPMTFHGCFIPDAGSGSDGDGEE